MAVNNLIGFLLFIATIDNLGIISKFATLLLGVLLIKGTVFKSQLPLLLIPILITFFSFNCFDKYWTTLFSILIKSFVVVLLFSRAKSFIYKITFISLCFHILSGIIVFLIILSPFSTTFISFMPYDVSPFDKGFLAIRPIGFYDEPSTYGFSMLIHIFVLLLMKKDDLSLLLKGLPFLTFSTPIQIITLLNISLKFLKKRFFFILLPLLLLFGFIVIEHFLLRDSVYKLSPLTLRVNHYIIFSENPAFIFGRGLCSAYGIFDMELSKVDLRNLYLSNFKDAGQILFSADRFGILIVVFSMLFLYMKLGFRNFLMFLSIMFFLKIPVYSFVTLFLIGGALRYEKSN